MDPCRPACCELVIAPSLSVLFSQLISPFPPSVLCFRLWSLLIWTLLGAFSVVSQQLTLPPLHCRPWFPCSPFSKGNLSTSPSCPAPSKGPCCQDGGCGPALAACVTPCPPVSSPSFGLLARNTELLTFLTGHVFLSLLPLSVDQRGGRTLLHVGISWGSLKTLPGSCSRLHDFIGMECDLGLRMS